MHDFNWDHILGASEWPAEIETPSSSNENMDPHRAAATTSPGVPVPNCPKISVFLFVGTVTFTTSKSLGVFTWKFHGHGGIYNKVCVFVVDVSRFFLSPAGAF